MKRDKWALIAEIAEAPAIVISLIAVGVQLAGPYECDQVCYGEHGWLCHQYLVQRMGTSAWASAFFFPQVGVRSSP
jgi:hypothetical protein